MKMKLLLGLVATVIAVTGCVKTQSGRSTYAVPLLKDRVEGRYERPATLVYQAAKDVIHDNGVLLNEVTQHNGTNAVVLALEARVQERKVFIGVKELEPQLSQVTVQVRTSAGGRDLDLAHELEKQIALKLVR